MGSGDTSNASTIIHGVDVSTMLPKPVKKFERYPELKGTEKQVAWAKEIRKQIIHRIMMDMKADNFNSSVFSTEKMVEYLKTRNLINGTEGDLQKQKIKQYCNHLMTDAQRYNRLKELASNDSAKFWIDNNPRDSMTNYSNKKFSDYVMNGKGMISKSASFNEILKFNPYHGRDGRFTGPGAATSFTYAPGKSRAHDMAIEREKKRTAEAGGSQSGGSGDVQAIRIDTGSGYISYRANKDGRITDMDGMPKDTNGKTIEELHSKAKELGWKVETFNDSQLKEYDTKRNKDKENTSRFLNDNDVRTRGTGYKSPRKGWKGH